MEIHEVLSEAKSFIEQFRSLQLATSDCTGKPEASYAPFIREGYTFYIYVSRLSTHTGNLLQNPQASILFISDERDTKQIFARQRLTLTAMAQEIPRDSVQWEEKLAVFAEEFGEIMQVLKPMQDFHLFALKVSGGNYVRGFAQAYRLSGEDLSTIAHRNEVGHENTTTSK
jgi:putative heme iron utilization protein